MGRSQIFGPAEQWPDQDLIAFSSQFDAGLVAEAYRAGVFPMPLHNSGFGEMGWWSPMRRGIMTLDGVRITRSMRQSAKHYTTTVDQAFDQVLARCADPGRPYGWIDDAIVSVYTQLHRVGVVHSVETWNADGRLVGGLYGVSAGGLFAGESMFNDPVAGRDASKVALMALVDVLSDDQAPYRVIDTQWLTPHLASLGAIEIDRSEYLSLLDEVLDLPDPAWPNGGRQKNWQQSAKRF